MEDYLKQDNEPIFYNAEKTECASKEIVVQGICLDKIKELAVAQIARAFENNVLFPNYIHSYIVLDSLNLPYFATEYSIDFFTSSVCRNFVWGLSALNLSTNNSTIILKYPISEVIRVTILPFYLPYYYKVDADLIYTRMIAPPCQRVQITIAEVVEKYATSSAENYTLPATATRDSVLYDGVNNSLLSKIEPVNSGEITFRYTVESMTTLSFSFNDFQAPMYLPPPLMTGTIFFKGSPTGFKISDNLNFQGTLLTTGELIIIRQFTATDPIADASAIAQITRASGWLCTPGSTYTVEIPYDSSAMVGDATFFEIYVPARRLLIPMIITQIRPGTSI